MGDSTASISIPAEATANGQAPTVADMICCSSVTGATVLAAAAPYPSENVELDLLVVLVNINGSCTACDGCYGVPAVSEYDVYTLFWDPNNGYK